MKNPIQPKHILAAVAIAVSATAAANNGDNYIRSLTFLDSCGSSLRARVSTVYYDGMGREALTVTGVAADPGGLVCLRKDYDLRGNVEKEWLPVPGDAACLSGSAHLAKARAFYGYDEVAYTSYRYELSGRNRVTDSYGPGKYWKNHGVRTSWHKNTDSGDYSCSKLTVGTSTGKVKCSDVYPAGALRITETEDPDGMRTLVFEDRLGRKILERRIGVTNGYAVTADTRFVYDRRGDLRYVISPEGCRYLSEGEYTSYYLERYAQCFDYDAQHRCVSSRMPGCGAVEYVYDRLGNVIFTSDAEQRTRSEWTMTKYDPRHRPALRGTVTMTGQSRQSLQTTYGDSLLTETFKPGEGYIETYFQYTWHHGPKSFTPYMAWYYDSYDFMTGANSGGKASFEQCDGSYTTQGLCTGTAMLDADSNYWLTAMKYDGKGNVIRQTMWDCWLQDVRFTTETEYDFVNQPVSRTETLESVSEGMVTGSNSARFDMVYDDYGRLTKQTLTVDGKATVTIGQYEYDTVGRLVRTTGAVDVSYAYDIRSHLISTDSDVYGETAVYDNPDGLAGQSYSWVNRITDTWKGDAPFTLSASYSYDGLGRLTQSESSDKKYSEKLTFDLDANVTDVRRLYRGATIQWASAQEMEGPRILELYDASGPYYSGSVGRFPAGEYTYGYDRCGRTTYDGTRDATISYHKWLDLPRRINIGDGNFIQNSYLPDGTLTGRIFNTKRINTIVRVNSKGDTIVTQRRNDLRRTLRFFGSFEKEGTSLKVHTPEGYYAVKEGRHYQYIRNRQGSTMAVVNDAGEVVQRTGYYATGTPFVLPVDSSDGSVTPLDSITDRLHIGNRWLGHLGLAMYDNTARVHDPVMPHMLTCDKYASKFSNFSPFSHCGGNPANALDADGNLVIFANGFYAFTGGGKSYWQCEGFNFANEVMNHLNDFNAKYKDGSFGGLLSIRENLPTEARRHVGEIEGYADAEDIINNLKRNENGDIVEHIKLISHSMGSAYMKGYGSSILKYADDNDISGVYIDFEADFAPYIPTQQKAINHPNMGPTYQFSHNDDFWAGNKPIDGAVIMDTGSDKDQKHELHTFKEQIKNIPLDVKR